MHANAAKALLFFIARGYGSTGDGAVSLAWRERKKNSDCGVFGSPRPSQRVNARETGLVLFHPAILSHASARRGKRNTRTTTIKNHFLRVSSKKDRIFFFN
jgi:hypothetical protein